MARTAASARGTIARRAIRLSSSLSQYLSRTGTAALRGQSGTGGWWRCGWLKATSAASDTYILNTRSGNTGTIVQLRTPGPLVAVFAGNGSALSQVNSSVNPLSLGTWYFWFAYYDGTNIGVSINAGVAVTATLSTFSPGTNDFQLGAESGPANFMNGLEQCVGGDDSFYSLTPAQLATALYNGGSALRPAQLTAVGVTISSSGFYFNLDGDLVDSGPNAYTLTNNGGATFDTGTGLGVRTAI